MTLVGRDLELRAVAALLNLNAAGGGALVVVGDPGIGKSALLGRAVAMAHDRGLRVLRATGVQSEARLPFAGLHQLLLPVLGAADALPARQRDALLTAFGMAESDPPDPFMTALAALNMLADVAAGTPLLLAVEDAHWLDAPTADVLAFVARRVDAEPVALLAVMRDGASGAFTAPDLPVLRLDALDAASSEALLDRTAPVLSPSLRERLLREAAGNPLALVELPLGLDGPRAESSEWLPLTARLEQAFAARAVELPPDTRGAVLIAALDDGDELAELLAAASILAGHELGVDAIVPAIGARLLDLDGTTLRFHHPLMRSAIHQAAAVDERCAAHAALAVVLAGAPDRRVWHRAASLLRPDGAVALELEAAALRAERRGATAVALAALEASARLSDDAALRATRLMDASELAFELGRHDTMLELLDAVSPLELGPRERQRLEWLRETLGDRVWSGAARLDDLARIAAGMGADGDAERALASLVPVALRCWWSNPEQRTRDAVAAAAEALPVGPDDPARVAVLAMAAPVQQGAEVLRRLEPGVHTDPAELRLLALAASAVGDFETCLRLSDAAVAGLRAQGRLGLLAHALVTQAWAAILMGSAGVALPAAEEAGRLARETDQPRWSEVARLAEAAIAGRRGDAETSEALAAAAERVILPMAAGPMLSLVQLARGQAALGSGRPGDAYAHLRRIFDPADMAHHPFVSHWVVGDLAEAALRSGNREQARMLIGPLEPLAEQTRSRVLEVGLLLARPLLAPDERGGAVFAASLGADLSGWPFARARLLLGHGEWLRRRRRVAESRVPLRAAREAFDALGAGPWGDRARGELRASGETSRRRAPGALDQLTPQELQIAQMARSGLTNREIGERLYLSHRTVSSHLYRIFPKLGISSRAELRSAIPGAPRS
ncbi:MAG TPA: AAA family ATPase [Solirubrobacteraceae bacterium]|nr:AAA family ATPase [Solirubrobacteraceae bacterium]